MTITANGIEIDHELSGPEDGTPLVLVRGLGSQRIHWPDALIDGLTAHGFRIVTFDNRDAGRSARCPAPGVADDADTIAEVLARGEIPPAAYTLHDMARDVTGLMDALGIGRAHVFGISMGGGITQILAAAHADRLLSATIVMSAAGFAPVRMAGMLARPASRDRYIADAVAAEVAWGSPCFPRPEAAVRAEAARAFDRGAEADAFNRQVLAIAASGDRRADLAGIALPCLVLHGEDDALVPVEAGREIAALIPGAEFEAIPGMGHVITPALAPLIVDRVASFIARTRA